MKKISILVPTYNEQDNVKPLSEAIVEILTKELGHYDYELVFIDNCSTDQTRPYLEKICSENNKIKAIFNSKNFGQFNSPYYGMCQTTGDCTILMCADFQDPIDMIPKFVTEWEKNYKIVIGIKKSSKENGLVYLFRSFYYKAIKNMSEVEQIEHFTGFGLYDKSFIETLKSLDDPSPFLRGIVAELGPARKEIAYEQQKRLHGKTSNNWYKLFDAAMLSFTSYTKIGLRLATFAGFLLSGVSLLISLIYLVLKLTNWNSFPMGIAPVLVGVFFLGSIQLFFIGFLGEYILSINTRVMKRPLVIEERRINFDENI